MSDPPDIDAAVAALAFSEATKRLTAQREDLEKTRSRSTGLLTVAVAAASLLGGAAIAGSDGSPPGGWRLWVGVVILGVIAILQAVVNWGYVWWFHMDAGVIVDDYAKTGKSIEDTHVLLAGFKRDHAVKNEKVLGRLTNVVAVIGVLVAAEVGSLLWYVIAQH